MNEQLTIDDEILKQLKNLLIAIVETHPKIEEETQKFLKLQILKIKL